MMFAMPESPTDQIQIHNAMVARVSQGLQQISTTKALVSQDLLLTDPGSEDYNKLVQTGKDLRKKELCLIDQERRLKERIACLQTGNSMGA
jgi:hypothetical protein